MDDSVFVVDGVEVLLVLPVLAESVEIEAESTPSGSESEQVSQVQSLPSSSEVTEHCLKIEHYLKDCFNLYVLPYRCWHPKPPLTCKSILTLSWVRSGMRLLAEDCQFDHNIV